MRRYASLLLVSFLLITLAAGCSSNKKRSKDVQTSDAAYDPYTPPVYEQPAAENDPYRAEETYPALADASYGSSTTLGSGTRYHTVAKGDTLYKLARTYYGDQARWKDVYAANRDSISDPNKIRVGQRLVIP